MATKTPLAEQHLRDTRTTLMTTGCPGMDAIANTMRVAEKAIADAGNGALITRTDRMRRIAAMQRILAGAMDDLLS